jgi:hypothetical protein
MNLYNHIIARCEADTAEVSQTPRSDIIIAYSVGYFDDDRYGGSRPAISAKKRQGLGALVARWFHEITLVGLSVN